MTDDLVKRLRESRAVWEDACGVPTQLEAEAADRIEALEASMAKAAEALDEAWWMLTVPYLNYEPEPEEPGLRCIKTALAELKEQK
jgi:hypothetical protein